MTSVPTLRWCLGAAFLLTLPRIVAAQAPSGCTIRTDAGEPITGVQADAMAPGFHLTTGPAAIVFDSTMRARGDWRLEATLHLFDPGGRAEGFGVFFGGRDLLSAAPQYAYALVRRDGRALLKARDRSGTHTVREWAANGGIPVWKSGPPGTSVRYPIVVEAIGDRATMWVGAVRVLDAARNELPNDGIVGIRVNHMLNVHVERISVAPVPRR